MRKKISVKEPFKKALSVLLVVIVTATSFIFSPPFVLNAGNVNTPFTQVFEMMSDPDTSVPNFSDEIDANGFPVENGRLWTDKTVSAEQAVIYNAEGRPLDTVFAREDEFLVTLSALSQSFTVETIPEPSDTVFVIDVSGSMYTNSIDGRTRIEVLIDALNMAIRTLKEANPYNRIAVVAYGGQTGGGANVSRAVNILPLARYDISGGIYFTVSGDQITVTSLIPDTALASSTARTTSVEGGTPTQRGIFTGAQVLLDNDTILFSAVDSDGNPVKDENNNQVELVRSPNIILMTDGVPTLGWTNYRFRENESGPSNDSNPFLDNTDNSIMNNKEVLDVGNASASDMSISLLTVLTASYMKRLVHEHYFGLDMSRTVGFFTIGLTKEPPPLLVLAAMDPYGETGGTNQVNADLANQAFSGVTYNMGTLLDSFSAGNDITFPALNRASGTQRRLVTVSNSNRFVRTADYTTLSFAATNEVALQDAFNQIASHIVTQGSYSTSIPEGTSPNFEGYLVFSDVLGEYMEFRGFEGLWFQNNRFDPEGFVNKILADIDAPAGAQTGTLATFIEVMRTHQDDEMNEQDVLDFVRSNRNQLDEFGSMKYYADAERTFKGSFFDEYGNPATVPADAKAVVELFTVTGAATDSLTGEATDLMYIAFHVVTTLEAGNFLCVYDALVRPLEAGDQFVRWYIPASLIPLRTVTPILNEDNEPTGAVRVTEAPPIRLIYSVGLNTERVFGGISNDYITANSANGGNSVYIYTNRWRNENNRTFAFFRPHEYNPYYFDNNGNLIETGSPTESVEKSLNITDTSAFMWQGKHLTDNGGNLLAHAQELGNNGRMRLQLSELEVLKEWILPVDVDLADYNSVVWIDSVLVQLYANGIAIREPVELTPNTDPSFDGNPAAWYTWYGIPVYSLNPDANGNAVLMEYTVLEGSIVNGVFIPYGPGNPNEDYNTTQFQPRWNEATNSWEIAHISNFGPYEYMWQLVLIKEIVGVDPAVLGQIQFDIYKGNEGEFPEVESSEPNITVNYPENFSSGKYLIVVTGNDSDSIKIVEHAHSAEVDGVYFSWLMHATGVVVDHDGNTQELTLETGFDNNNPYIIISDIANLSTVTVTLTNEYEPTDAPVVNIIKEFAGSLTWDDEHDITFLLEGWTTAEGGTQVFSQSFDLSAFDQTSGIQIENLPPGYYSVSEFGAENSTDEDWPEVVHDVVTEITISVTDENDSLVVQAPDERAYIGPGYTATFTVTNTYSRRPSLIIIKELVDEDGEPIELDTLPAGLLFTVTSEDDENFMPIEIPFNMFIESDGENQTPSSGTRYYKIANLPSGRYKVTEAGMELPGFDGPTEITIAVTDNNDEEIAVTEPDIGDDFVIVTLESNSDTNAAPAVVTVTFTNKYEKADILPAALLLIKLFTGDVPDPLPLDDIIFSITGDETTGTNFGFVDSYEGPYSFVNGILEIPFNDFANSDEIPPGYNISSFIPPGASYLLIEGLIPGSYTVAETGGQGGQDAVFGLAVNPAEFTVSVGSGHMGIVTFDNVYTSLYGSLIIEKVFEGLREGIVIPDVQFHVVGTESAFGEEIIFEDTFSLSDFYPETGRIEISQRLPAGWYTITEIGGDIPGFDWILPNPERLYITGGASVTVQFINRYNHQFFDLIIEKIFEGLEYPLSPEILLPEFVLLLFEGANVSGQPIEEIPLTDLLNGPVTVEDLPIGTYTIAEAGHELPGFSLQTNYPLPHTFSTSESAFEITLVNTYTPKPGSITLQKTFMFTDGDGNEMYGPDLSELSEISFTIVGTSDSREVFRRVVFFKEFTLNNGYWEFTIDNLPAGSYVIHESGGFISNFVFYRPMPGAIQIPNDEHGAEIIVPIHNSYSYNPSWEPRMYKVFHGLTDAEIIAHLQYFEVVVTSPDDSQFSETFSFANGAITLANSVAEINVGNLAPGNYHIMEYNYDVPGFAVRPPVLPIEFTIPYYEYGEGSGVVIVIDNVYSLTTGSITIEKDFRGISIADIPYNFAIEIVPGVTTTPTAIRVITLEELLQGAVTVSYLSQGYYTIKETGAYVPGYTLSVYPQLPHTVYVNEWEELDVRVRIVNEYSPIIYPPPPIPPEPPTGPEGEIVPEIPLIPYVPRPRPPIEPPEPPLIEDPHPTPEPPPPIPIPPPPMPIIEPPAEEPTEEPEELPPTEPARPTLPPSPQTGDMRETAPFIALIFAGFGLMGIAAVFLKKRKIK